MAAAIRDAASSSSSVRPHTRRAHARARLALAAAAALPLLSAAAAAHADLYWDLNGATANTGTSGAGTWSATTTNWNTDSTGTGGAAVAWTATGDRAVFSSGTNYTGTFAVNVVGTQTITGIVFEEGALTLNGAGSLSIGSTAATITTSRAGTETIQVPIVGSGDLTIANTSGGDVTYNIDGQMSGFTGNLIVGAGTNSSNVTKVQLDWAPGDATKTITLNSYSELGNNNQVTLSGGITTPLNYNVPNPIVLAGSNAWITSARGIAPTTTTGGVITAPGQQKIVTYSGVISGTGNLWIGINDGGGRGTVVLGGHSTYAGNTYIVQANSDGLVQLGVDDALPTTTVLNFGSPTSGKNPAVAPFDMNGHSQTLAGLASITTGAVPGIYNLSPTPVTLTLNQNANTTFKGTFGATATSINPFNEMAPYYNNTTAYTNISLVKNGTGNLTLSAANNNFDSLTVNGGTVTLTGGGNLANNASVTGGTLAVTNASNITTGLTVGGGSGTLNVSGTSPTATGTYASGTGVTTGSTLSGSIALGNFGALAPGNAGSVGLMAVTGNVNFNDGSSFNLDWLNSGNVDSLYVPNGNVNFDAGAHTLNLALTTTGSSPITAGTYHIITAGSGINAPGTTFTIGSVPDSNFRYSVGFDPVYGSNVLDLFITPMTTVLRWDSDGGGNPVIEGAGTWSNNSTSWVDLSTGNQATFTNGTAVDVVIGGDTFQQGGTISLGDNVTVTGKLTFSPVTSDSPYVIDNNGGHSLTLSTAGPTSGLQADTPATINAPVLLDGSQTWTVNGGASTVLTVASLGQTTAGASATLTKNGSGYLVLTGANPGNGLTGLNVAAGAVLLRDANALAPSTAVTVDTGGIFGLDASVSIANPITVGTGGGTLVSSATNTATMSGNITATGNVTKNGGGVLALTGTNSFTNLTIAGGAGSLLSVANPAALTNAAITLNSGGIQVTAPITLPNNFTFSASGTNGPNDVFSNAQPVTLTGSLAGSGDWHKKGGGSLTLAGPSTTKGGAFYLDDASTIVVTNATGLGIGTIAVNSNATLDIETANVNAAYIRGDATDNVTVHKTGTGNLTLAAPGSGVPGSNNRPGTTMSIDAGSITLDSSQGLGGNTNVDQMNVTVNAGAELIANYVDGSDRIGGNLNLNGGTVTLPATAPFSTNLETNLLQAYTKTTVSGVITNTDHGNAVNVTANSTIRSLMQATDTTTHLLSFQGPVNIASGTTLTTDNENAGGYDNNNTIAFRGSIDLTAVPNDAITLAPGATLVTTGPGQTRFGRAGSQGKVIVGKGTAAASESVIKFGSNAFLNDSGGTNGITRFIVSGSGNAGLRIEAAMNSSYRAAGDTDPTHHEGTTGLFGQATNGSHYTVLSNNRMNALSAPYGSPALPVGGTLTVAANDATDVTGAPLTAGPSAASPLTLAFDNTASSANANLTYTLNGTGATGATIVNFAKLQVQKTNAGTGSVKLALAGNTHVNDVSLLNSTKFDLVDHALAIEAAGTAATYLANGQLFSSAVNNDPNATSTIAQIHGSDLGLAGTDTTTFDGLTLGANTLLLAPAYYGDINLDGRINADDYALMDRSVAKSLTPNWINGDFNADNAVNSQDYFLLDRSYGLTHGNSLSPDLLAERRAEFGDAYVSSLVASVPEPTSLTLLSLGALPLLSRRRRTTR